MDERAAPTRLPIRAATGGANGSATRLLVLGCVRLFAPVHGYFLHRELISWRVDEWANVHPGSIYNALRSLTRGGLLEQVQTGSAGARPARTTYRLTTAGDREFLALLRVALRSTEDPTAFLTAVSMGSALPRAEILDAVGDHVDALGASIARAEEDIAEMLASPEKPDSATEVMRIISARAAGELTWAVDYLARVRAGAYAFAGERPDWVPTEEQVAEAFQAGVGLGVRPVPPTG